MTSIFPIDIMRIELFDSRFFSSYTPCKELYDKHFSCLDVNRGEMNHFLIRLPSFKASRIGFSKSRTKLRRITLTDPTI